MLLGNKTDMPESQWEVKREDAQRFAEENSKNLSEIFEDKKTLTYFFPLLFTNDFYSKFNFDLAFE